MPEIIKKILVQEHLWDAYQSRPPYQRNDYLGWIRRARLSETKEKRTRQMVEELRKGDRYMNMQWKPR